MPPPETCMLSIFIDTFEFDLDGLWFFLLSFLDDFFGLTLFEFELLDDRGGLPKIKITWLIQGVLDLYRAFIFGKIYQKCFTWGEQHPCGGEVIYNVSCGCN